MPTEKAANIATSAAYTAGASTAGAGALTLSDWAIIIGIVISVATFFMNWYFQRRRIRIDAEHKEWIRQNAPVVIEQDAGTDGSPNP